MTSKTLQALKDDPRVAEVWREDDGCFGHNVLSYWVSLHDEYICADMECGSIHERTVKDLWQKMQSVVTREQYHADVASNAVRGWGGDVINPRHVGLLPHPELMALAHQARDTYGLSVKLDTEAGTVAIFDHDRRRVLGPEPDVVYRGRQRGDGLWIVMYSTTHFCPDDEEE